MPTLTIRHVNAGEPGPAKFMLLGIDGQATEAVEIKSPVGFPVEGRDRDLHSELQWYLENFLEYPFDPELDHAERVQAALKAWGVAAFQALFAHQSGMELYAEIQRKGLKDLTLRVASDDPAVLGWPWEALEDPRRDTLAHQCQIERRLNKASRPEELSRRLPKDKVNILLVTARPFQADVHYRSISRPLFDLIQTRNLPAEVTVLRPPTLKALQDHLRGREDYYHVLHFDGHGSYGQPSATSGTPLASPGPYIMGASVGCLVFEDDDGKPSPVPAGELGKILGEFRIPAVVLNACQSAMVDGNTENAFNSVAASLIKAGTRSVVAMAYSLYVSAAQVFLPDFYAGLFRTGSVARATREGRLGMVRDKKRTCSRGKFPLEDWLVPVVYQNEPFDFSFAKNPKPSKKKAQPAQRPLPQEILSAADNPHGFIGRDSAVLELERAMRRKPAGLLIQGLGGVGKTTLAKGFVTWLRDSGGLGEGALWVSFQGVRSAEHIFNQLGMPLLGDHFGAITLKDKVRTLVEVFKQKPFVIVWDNFEDVRGVEGTSVGAHMAKDDQDALRDFLAGLRGGGKSKVILTSRGDESWLGDTNRYAIRLRGLEGEERWDYCTAILDDLGLTIDRDDRNLSKLMDLLAGHPLAMRVILPRLQSQSAGSLIRTLQTNLTQLQSTGDKTLDRLFATLSLAEQALPDDLRPILIPLALHERFVDADILEEIGKQLDPHFPRPHINRALEALSRSGLLHPIVGDVHELHPALTGFLRATYAPNVLGDRGEPWARAFVNIMGSVAAHITPRLLHEQRTPFHLHGASFHVALTEAERLGMIEHVLTIYQCLATHALNTLNLAEARRLYERQALYSATQNDSEWAASAYHQLGIIAQRQRDFSVARDWYMKSLRIREQSKARHGAAGTYHQLGMLAEDERDFTTAQDWYMKSLRIKEQSGDLHGAAITMHHLGVIAQEEQDYKAAHDWYIKSLHIEEQNGNLHGAAITYHQLGTIALLQRDVKAARDWCIKSLRIKEQSGDLHGAAGTYRLLGMIAQEQRDYKAAHDWYMKSLQIEERSGDIHSAAQTYGALGWLAKNEGNLHDARKWLEKALTQFRSLNDNERADGTQQLLDTLDGPPPPSAPQP